MKNKRNIILGELTKRGASFASVARELGISRQQVSRVVAGGERSPVVESRIAKIIGFNPWESAA